MRIIKNIISINTFFSFLGSILMKVFLRLNGAKIGKNTFISINSRIAVKNLIIGNDCKIKSRTKIRANKFILGNSCIISEDCYMTGGDNLYIGDMSFIGKKVRINIAKEVKIGRDVGIGENSVIWTHGYFPPADEGYPIIYKPVTISDKVWVSTNIILLPGVILGKGVIVGAGSVITKSFDDYSLIAGNPAKFIKSSLDLKDKKNIIEVIKDIFLDYPEIKLIKEINDNLEFEWDGYKIIFINKNINFDLSSFQGETIAVYKNLDKDCKYKLKKFMWIDLSNRKTVNSKNRYFKKIISIMRANGIRFSVDYNDA